MHLGLLIACAAGGVWVLTRPAPQPSPAGPGRSSPSEIAQLPPEAPAQRSDVDRATRALSIWVDGAYRRAETPLDQLLGLQGLGKRQAIRNNSALPAPLKHWSSKRPLAPLPGPSGTPELAPMRAVATLLEAGLGLKERVATADGEVELGQLAAALWTSSKGERIDPGARLRLGAIAALAGGQFVTREELATLASRAIAQLQRGLRDYTRSRGQGPLTAAEVARAARLRASRQGLFALPHEGAELGAAAFRALEFVRDAELLEAGRRLLPALTYKHSLDRAVLAAETSSGLESAGERRMRAAEQLGRHLQLLYGAHVATRRPGQAGPARSLQRALTHGAQDLLLLLEAVQHSEQLSGPLKAAARGGPAAPGPLRTAVQVLRGLRVTRAAVPRGAGPHGQRNPHAR